jgi:hypothetical protein
MSKLTETKRAYDKLSSLLDQEIRKRSGSTAELERFRQTLDVAFYLLGWAQFEYRVRGEANDLVKNNARLKTLEGQAWRLIAKNVKGLTVRERLDLLFHGNTAALSGLHKDYDIRNEAAHDYRSLPEEARDLAGWLQHLEELLDKF